MTKSAKPSPDDPLIRRGHPCNGTTLPLMSSPNRMFGGNPVAVVFDADGLSESQMQAIAVEFNYLVTTFVLRASQPEYAAWVRIFTPSSEIPFAGHPNVGTAFALAARMGEGGEAIPDHFVFEEEAGLVPVSLIRENGSIIGAELCAPEPLSRRGHVSPENAAACLSLNVGEIRSVSTNRRSCPSACRSWWSNWRRATPCDEQHQIGPLTINFCR